MSSASKSSAGPAAKPATSPDGPRRVHGSELRAAKDALYREHIMEAAEHIFATQGFANTKMQDIARAVGVSLSTLYSAYSGKEELHRAILVARDGEMLKAVMAGGQQVLQQPQSIERLLWMMEIHLGFLLDHPDYLRLLLHEGHPWYHANSRPSADEQLMWERGLSLMKHVFIWGQSNELLVTGDPAEQARLMLALQQARLAGWVMAGMDEDHRTVLVRVQADFVRLFCRPAVAAGMLTPDGAGLNEKTLAAMRAAGSA